MGLGANVEVTWGELFVAGSEVEVGWGLGGGGTRTWQAPSNMLISKMTLTRLKGIDLEQADYPFIPQNKSFFMRWCGSWFREPCIKRSTGLLKSLTSQALKRRAFCPPPWLGGRRLLARAVSRPGDN